MFGLVLVIVLVGIAGSLIALSQPLSRVASVLCRLVLVVYHLFRGSLSLIVVVPRA